MCGGEGEKNLWLARKVCDWKLRDRFFVLWLLLRPLPWQVRLHGRSKKLNKSIYFFVLGGRWHGDYSFIIFYYPGSPPAGVWCFFAFLFFFLSSFFFLPTLTLAVFIRYQIFNDSQSRCLRAKKGKQKVQSIETHQFYIHGTLIT